jgi:hypothetical protein
MYNFKKNSKLYLVQNGLKYKLEIYPDFSASQTFDEQGYRRKTLHDQAAVHEHATIVKASPANFSFTVPFFDQSTIQKEIELATTYTNGVVSSFDLYIESDNIIYKIEKAVFNTTTFNIARDAPLTVSLSGSGSRISKVSSIPGTLQPAPTREYTRVSTMQIQIGGVTFSAVTNINIEIENDITWIKNDTIHDSLTGNIIYPQSYVLSGRQVKGSVSHFITTENQNDLQDESTESSLSLSINPNLLAFTLPSVVFTRRSEFGDLISRTYDYRLNTNSSIVKPIYKGV